METRIGRWHGRFQAYGTMDRALAAARSLGGSGDAVLPALGDAIERTFGDDETVYVLRSVHLERMVIPADSSSGAQASRLGRGLGAGVIRTILRDPGDGQNLVRFSEEGEFAARFLTDLLADRAWGRWYYGAFARFRESHRADTVRAVLEAHTRCLARLLAWLEKLGSLRKVLEEAGAECAERCIARAVLSGRPVASSALVRPLFDAAVGIARRRAWLDRSVSLEPLLGSYIGTGAPTPDWKDRPALTAGVLSILWFLIDRGAVIPRAASTHEDGLLDLDGLDWVDGPALESGLTAMRVGRPTLRVGADAGLLPGQTVSPRQLDLAEALTLAIRERGAIFSGGSEAQQTLRVLAALDKLSPRWSKEPLAIEMAAQLCLLVSVAARGGGLELLRRAFDPAAPVPPPLLAEDVSRDRFEAAVRTVRRLGAARLQLAAALESRLRALPDASSELRLDTLCAGLFLMMRAILDARLPAMLSRAGYPCAEESCRLPLFLAAIGCAWAGESSLTAGRLDAGLSWWAGWDEPPTADVLANAWDANADSLRFQQELLGTLAGHRMLSPAKITLYRWEDSWIAAGDPEVWPLGIEQAEDPFETFARTWAEATGVRPERGAPDGPGMERLRSTLDCLHTPLRLAANAALTVSLSAACLLRFWARWLRRFSGSSTPYLIEQLIRRPGTLRIQPDRVVVELESRGLDLILEMSGYLALSPPVPWLGGRSIELRTGGS